MGHGGIPAGREIDLLELMRRESGAPVSLFGDLDPDDLLVYSALRAGLKGRRVEYAGVNSRLLNVAADALGAGAVEQAARPMDRREKALMRFIRTKELMDLESLLGPAAVHLLERGQKIEIESILPPLLSIAKSRQTILSALGIGNSQRIS